MASLDDLPSEIQNAIYRLLDPVGLISLSQTSTRLRRHIRPAKRHFVERLLVLETVPEFGGPSYSYNYSDFQCRSKPLLDSPEWNAMRFACGTCLRLRHHINFTNQYLARRAFRKPSPGSSAARRLDYTTWEAGYKRGPRGSHAEYQRQHRHRYTTAMSGYFDCCQWRPGSIRINRLEAFQNAGFQNFKDMTLEQYEDLDQQRAIQLLKEEIDRVRNETDGYNRGARKCHDCALKGGKGGNLTRLWNASQDPGQYNWNRPVGDKTIPVLRKFSREFNTTLDRWVSGALDYIGAGPRLTHFYPNWTLPWTSHLYAVRCPRCRKWKELRELRIYTKSNQSAPLYNLDGYLGALAPETRTGLDNLTESQIRASVCNACVLERDGQEALERELAKWVRFHVRNPLHQIQYYLATELPNELILKTIPTLVDSVANVDPRDRFFIHEASVHRIWTTEEFQTVAHWGRQVWQARNEGRLAELLGPLGISVEQLRFKPIDDSAAFELRLFAWEKLIKCQGDVGRKCELLVEWARSRDARSLI